MASTLTGAGLSTVSGNVANEIGGGLSVRDTNVSQLDPRGECREGVRRWHLCIE